ncbi:hypothetical protein H8E77_32055 [bacterium]|nr:hypothetical protein [bacterium]
MTLALTGGVERAVLVRASDLARSLLGIPKVETTDDLRRLSEEVLEQGRLYYYTVKFVLMLPMDLAISRRGRRCEQD